MRKTVGEERGMMKEWNESKKFRMVRNREKRERKGEEERERKKGRERNLDDNVCLSNFIPPL